MGLKDVIATLAGRPPDDEDIMHFTDLELQEAVSRALVEMKRRGWEPHSMLPDINDEVQFVKKVRLE